MKAAKVLLLAVSALAVHSVQAQVMPAGTVNIFRTASGVKIYTGPASASPGVTTALGSRAITSGSAGAVAVVENYATILGPRGPSAAIAVARTIPVAGVASAIAVAGAFEFGWQVGSKIADAAGIGSPSTSTRLWPTGSGWEVDEGLPKAQQTIYTMTPNFSSSSKMGVCTSWTAGQTYSTGYSKENPRLGGTGSNTCYFDLILRSTQTGEIVSQQTMFGAISANTGSHCSESIDFHNPIYSQPAGHPVGPDGKCHSGAYVPISETAVVTRVQNNGNKPKFADAIKDILDNKPNAIPNGIPAGAPTTSGPSANSDPVPSSTTSTPAPTPAVPNPVPVTTTTYTTYNYTYQGDTINYTITNTTTNSEGGTTTETGPPPTEAEEQAECVKYPGTVGCMKPGDVPQSPEWAASAVQVGITPELPWGADNASCPAPHVVNVQGRPVTIDNTLFCTFFSGVRPVVLAAAWLIAVMIFVGARGSE